MAEHLRLKEDMERRESGGNGGMGGEGKEGAVAEGQRQELKKEVGGGLMRLAFRPKG